MKAMLIKFQERCTKDNDYDGPKKYVLSSDLKLAIDKMKEVFPDFDSEFIELRHIDLVLVEG